MAHRASSLDTHVLMELSRRQLQRLINVRLVLDEHIVRSREVLAEARVALDSLADGHAQDGPADQASARPKGRLP